MSCEQHKAHVFVYNSDAKLYKMKYYPGHVSHYCMSQFLFRLCLRPRHPTIADIALMLTA